MSLNNTESRDGNVCESCEKPVAIETEHCPHCGEEQPEPINRAVGPMIGNGISGLFNVMGVGHMVSGHVGRGIWFMLAGWGLVIILVALWFAGLVGSLSAVPLVGIITGLLTLLTFPAYIGIWVWSIVDVKKVIEKEQ